VSARSVLIASGRNSSEYAMTTASMTQSAGRRRRARRSQNRVREMPPVSRRSASKSDVIR
jgi:hypothetical protein